MHFWCFVISFRKDEHSAYTHLICSQCTCFIGANNTCTTQCFNRWK
ncbi:unnamed protein product [Schistosoma curassoni]|uniref:Uncharacterized protein n=1 Tax=Schistosoma curassoni TaxID=6186 RepID=A0A183K1S1_9TREM|nr:unnamed protein product [Schistosoma curassoni]